MKLASSTGKHLAIVLTVSLGGVLAACGDDDPGSPVGNGGTGTAGTGTAGMGTGGTGTAGMGTAGMGTAGMGTAGMGTAGMGTAGMGTAGMGTAGMGAMFAPLTLFTFDDPAPMANNYGWLQNPDLGGTLSIIDQDQDAANITPGALRWTAVFPDYDVMGNSASVQTRFEYGSTNILQGASTVTFWLRLVSSSDDAALYLEEFFGFQPFLQAGSSFNFAQSNFFSVGVAALADNDWHEFTFDISAATYLADLFTVGLQLVPAARPASGPGDTDAGIDMDAGMGDAGMGDLDAGTELAAPPPVTIDIDFITAQ